MLVQCRYQQRVVGEGECELHLRDFTLTVSVFELLDRPVVLRLRIAVETDALRSVVAGIRVDQDEWMRAAFERRAGDEPRFEQALVRLALGATIDQMQARTTAVERAQESGDWSGLLAMSEMT